MKAKGVRTLEEAMRACFEFWGERRDEILMYIDNNIHFVLIEPFHECLDGLMDFIGRNEHREDPVWKVFTIGGMFAVLMDWIRDPKNRSAEDMAKAMAGFSISR